MILVSHNIYLSPTSMSDADALMEHLQSREILDNTSIPYPYKREMAEEWLEDNDIFREENGLNRNFAIRNKAQEIIGAIGLHYNYGLDAGKSEFGYWLAKPYWNKGTMTEVIKRFCNEVKNNYPIKILEAHVFDFNIASQKVLLKAGFEQKGNVKDRYKKDGRRIDGVKFIREL